MLAFGTSDVSCLVSLGALDSAHEHAPQVAARQTYCDARQRLGHERAQVPHGALVVDAEGVTRGRGSLPHRPRCAPVAGAAGSPVQYGKDQSPRPCLSRILEESSTMQGWVLDVWLG